LTKGGLFIFIFQQKKQPSKKVQYKSFNIQTTMMVLPKHKIFIEKGSKKYALLAKTEKHHLFDRFFSAE